MPGADYRIAWRPKALEDLRSIVRYIAQDSPARARTFGKKLRESAYAGTATLEQASVWAASALGPDVGGYRQECVELMLAARNLKRDWVD